MHLGLVCLANIAKVLNQVLAPGGKAIFCDPNRLGLDTIEIAFQENFNLFIKQIPLTWPPRKEKGEEKMVYLYEPTDRS
jgi:hypothetical protein